MSDFDTNKMLWHNRKVTNIDNYGKFEYFKIEDVCSYVNLLKSIFCRCTTKVECFYCHKIRLFSCDELLLYNQNKDQECKKDEQGEKHEP